MTTVVLSLGGAFLGLAVFKQPFGIIMASVGVISLAGIVVNNALTRAGGPQNYGCLWIRPRTPKALSLMIGTGLLLMWTNILADRANVV